MSAIPGAIPVTGFIGPTDSTDDYAVTDALYGIDGLRNVANTAARNLTSAERRREGMLVGTSDKKYWRLKASPWLYDDTDWELAFDLTSTLTGVWELVGSDIVTTATLYSPSVPNVLPAFDDAQDLGSKLYRWRDLFLGSKVDFSTVLDMTVGGGSPDDNIARFESTGLSMYTTKFIQSLNGGSRIELDASGIANNIAITTDNGGYLESFIQMNPDYINISGQAVTLSAVGVGSFGILGLSAQSDITLRGVGISGFGFGDFSADIAIADVSVFSKKNNSGYFCAPTMISSKGAQIGIGSNISVLVAGEDNTLGDAVSRSVMIAGLGNTIDNASDKIVMIGGSANSTNSGLTNTIIIGGSSFNASLDDKIYLAEDTILVSQKVIKSSNGVSQIELDNSGNASNILISTDAGAFADSSLFLQPGYTELSQYSVLGTIFVGTTSHGLSLAEGAGIRANLYSNNSTRINSTNGSYSIIDVGTVSNISQIRSEAYHLSSGIKAVIDMRPFETTPVIDFSITEDIDAINPHHILRLNGDTHYAEFFHGIGNFNDNTRVIETNARQLIDENNNPVIDWTNIGGSPAAPGVIYDQDYSSGYVARSLVDKEYVDNAVSGGSGTKYATTIGFLADTLETITHNLGDTDIIVELRDLGTGEKIWGALVNNYLSNSVDITLAATTSVRVVIKK